MDTENEKEMIAIYDEGEKLAKSLLKAIEDDIIKTDMLNIACQICISCIGASKGVKFEKAIGVLKMLWEHYEEAIKDEKKTHGN